MIRQLAVASRRHPDGDGTGGGKTWRHIPSGQNFGAAQGSFQRIRRTMLDETGHNIVVYYRIGPGGW